MFYGQISNKFFKSVNLLKLTRIRASYKHSTSNFQNIYKFAKNLDIGLKTAKLESKPVMLIVHRSHCEACRKLIPKLAGSNEVKNLSDNFIMVNALDGKDAKAKLYAPDGAHIPRVVFIRSGGQTLTEVTNPSIEIGEYKYYYQKVEDVIKSMKKALKLNKLKK